MNTAQLTGHSRLDIAGLHSTGGEPAPSDTEKATTAAVNGAALGRTGKFDDRNPDEQRHAAKAPTEWNARLLGYSK